MATSAEYELGEYAFPRGWFAVAESGQVTRAPLNVHYFGQDMVLYRGESGRVVMLDAYCPHMGTHIGKCENSATVLNGTYLEADSIRCPFHAWRFGPDGRCDHIPYFNGPIPEKARVKSWPVEERWGIVFCWHDPENQAPDFPLPEIPEWDNPRFVRWQGLDHVADLNHPVEVFDNESDAPHLEYLHGAGKVQAYENEVAGHLYHQRETLVEGFSSTEESAVLMGDTHGAGQGSRAASSPAPKTMTTVGAYHGTGLMLARFVEANGVQLLCITPVNDGECRVMSAAMIASPTGNTDAATDEQIRRRYAGLLVDGLRRDGEVWRHKKPALQILQLPTDGPFGHGRRWYSQFFNPREKAAAILKSSTGRHTIRGIQPWSESEYARMAKD